MKLWILLQNSGEGSETNVPEQTVHSETEMTQNQSDINEEAHFGTEPNIPDDSVNKGKCRTCSK